MASQDWDSIIRHFGLTDNGFRYPPRYNIAPTQNVMAVISDGKERRAGLLKWGIVPEWSETETHKFSTFNASVETLLVTPTFRHLVSRKRCVVVADGFIEWQRNTKKPYRIRVRKHDVFGLAALYDTWASPDDKKKVHCCTIITCAPNFFIKSRALQNRMPVILDRWAMDVWLNRKITDVDDVMPLLHPYEGDLYGYRVPELVDNVRNDSPACIAEIC